MINNERWNIANRGETTYWLDVLTSDEKIKQNDGFLRYNPVLGLNTDNVAGKRIIDIGGGPISIMYHFDLGNSAIVDPLVLPEKYIKKYAEKRITYYQVKAEDFLTNWNGEKWDEVWMYNCLQHVQAPEIILSNLRNVASVLRIGEPIGTGTDNEHPYSFTKEWLVAKLTEISTSQRFLFEDYDYTYFGGVFELK
jgi:2-polyprenyl-3-methyl-5-hydroxy-6-metoxy-1,4-benzoquinol methylase